MIRLAILVSGRGSNMICLADAIKAKKILGWSSKTSLRKLIKLMIEFELSK